MNKVIWVPNKIGNVWLTRAAAYAWTCIYFFFLIFRAEPTYLLFSTYFSFQQFFFYLFCSIFCSLSSYFSTHKRFFLVYLQLLSMHDCCIRVIRNMVTALLEFLDLWTVFQKHKYYYAVCHHSSRVSPYLQCKIG